MREGNVDVCSQRVVSRLLATVRCRVRERGTRHGGAHAVRPDSCKTHAWDMRYVWDLSRTPRKVNLMKMHSGGRQLA